MLCHELRVFCAIFLAQIYVRAIFLRFSISDGVDCCLPQMLCLIGESFDGESVLVNGAVVNVRNRVSIL